MEEFIVAVALAFPVALIVLARRSAKSKDLEE